MKHIGATQRLIKLLCRPWTPLTAALLGVALTIPALGGGLLVDDYIQRSILLGVGQMGRDAHPAFDLFSFVPQHGPRREAAINMGLVGWWADPDLRLALFRPLAALTHVLDYELWPNAIALQHMQSLLWYGLAVFAVAAFYRQVHGATAIAGLAALFFAVDDAHAMCAGWLANRHALISLVVGIGAVQAHCRWRHCREQRRSGEWKWPLIANALFAAALFCGEAGLAAIAYIVAWQLTMDDGAWKSRIASLLPYGTIIIAWHLLYEHLGYGGIGGSLYIDPGHHPVDFLLALPQRWPVLQMAQWFQVPSEPFTFLPRAAQIAWVVLADAACLGLVWVFRPLLVESREARFWATGMCLAFVPLCAAFPMDRLLLFPGVGAFGLLALFIDREAKLPSSVTNRPRGKRFAAVMVVLHGPLAAALLVARIVTLPFIGAGLGAIAAHTPADANSSKQTFVFVNGVDFGVGYLPIIRELENPAAVPRRVALLASFFHENIVYREAIDTLVITARGGFLQSSMEQLMRSPSLPFKIGEKVERPDFTAEVRTITADGRPEQVAFHFHAPLQSPEYRWLACSQNSVDDFPLPPVGTEVELPIVHIVPIGQASETTPAKPRLHAEPSIPDRTNRSSPADRD